MAGGNRGKSPQKPLREEVREALLSILRDAEAPATARAHAARSLVLMMGEEDPSRDDRPLSELSVDELDAEIASIQQPRR